LLLLLLLPLVTAPFQALQVPARLLPLPAPASWYLLQTLGSAMLQLLVLR
jgi:hypothetical protein